MKLKSIYLVGVLCSLFLMGCTDENYLSYNKDKTYSDQQIWSQYSYITDMGTEIYASMPPAFQNYGGGFLASSTDDCENSNVRNSIQNINLGTWTPFTNPLSRWTTLYKGIYNANDFIAHADTCTLYLEEYDQTTKKSHMTKLRHLRGEARFLKAYYYFELMKRYGEVPIAESWTDTYTPADGKRASVNQLMNLMEEVCNDAVELLPDVKLGKCVDGSMTNAEYKNSLGRPTIGTAYALLSRAYLYAASPLMNPDGTHDDYYLKCIEYSSKLFDRYALASSYKQLFTPGSGTMKNNTEVILDRRFSSSNSLEGSNFPTGYYGGYGRANPTQDLVDAYEMSDGSDFDWSNQEQAANPYINRDQRFEATILHNGEEMAGRQIQTWTGGLDAASSSTIGTRTGYYLEKYIDTTLDLYKGQKSLHYWYLFRYAEVLLNYAEAMNELYGPNVDPNGYGKTALDAINEVRERAGQPDLEAADYTQETFRNKVRHERRIELAFENHRHWDVRRWKIAENTIGAPIHGVDIERAVTSDSTTGEEVEHFTYTIKTVESRVFENKMYLYPIPASQLYDNNDLVQNPGWEYN